MIGSWKTWVGGLVVLGIAISAMDDSESAAPAAGATNEAAAVVSSAPTEEPTQAPAPEPTEEPAALLYMTDQKDGDSFVASDGTEYRLGLVNTPERDEPCGAEATAFTRDFLDDGFTVDDYSTDTYGRSVAEVFDADGTSLNVALAESGLGDGRFLEEFRSENPDLGSRLDEALASAEIPDCGTAAAAPVPLVAQPKKAPEPANDCMSGYSPCLPIVTDLNCPDVGGPVTVTGEDPYGLDRDGDGVGCD